VHSQHIVTSSVKATANFCVGPQIPPVNKTPSIKFKIERKFPFAATALTGRKAKLDFIVFSSPYPAESVFSWVTHLLSKVRNRVDAVTRGDCRLALTALQPDVQKLASVHQEQDTHRT
jgi:hypothetical protein